MKNWIIVALVAVIAIGGAVAFAQSSRTANVEIRVWESTSDPTRNYISARPEGGSWRTLGTIPLGTGDATAYEETSNGRFRYSDITLAVPLPESAAAPRPTATPTPTPSPTPTPTAVATATPAPSRATGPILGRHRALNGASYIAERDPIDDSLSTGIGVTDEYRDAYGVNQLAIFNIICTSSGTLGIGMSTDEYHRSGRITYRIDDRASVSVTWVPNGDQLLNPTTASAERLVESLRGASRLLIRTSEIDLLEFDVSGILQTPVQPNIDNCGQPGWR